jgi:hypothetical protein
MARSARTMTERVPGFAATPRSACIPQEATGSLTIAADALCQHSARSLHVTDSYNFPGCALITCGDFAVGQQ